MVQYHMMQSGIELVAASATCPMAWGTTFLSFLVFKGTIYIKKKIIIQENKTNLNGGVSCTVHSLKIIFRALSFSLSLFHTLALSSVSFAFFLSFFLSSFPLFSYLTLFITFRAVYRGLLMGGCHGVCNVYV